MKKLIGRESWVISGVLGYELLRMAWLEPRRRPVVCQELGAPSLTPPSQKRINALSFIDTTDTACKP